MKTSVIFLFCMFVVLLLKAQSAKVSSGPESSKLEEVFTDSTCQVSGLAVTNSHRLFVCYPYWLDQHQYGVVEIGKNAKMIPYPDLSWNNFKKGQPGKDKFVCVQAVYVDRNNKLWIVDPAGIGLGEVYDSSNKVLRVDLATNKIEKIYRFPESVAGEESYLNDIRLDEGRGFAYFSNSSNGGLVVLNTKTGESRLVLKGHPSTISDTAYHFNVRGNYMIKANGKPAKVNADGIAITHDRQWLFYKALTDDRLYKIETSLLRDFSTPQETINGAVKDLGHFVTTGGMEFDDQDNLYMGDLERSAIVKLSPDLKMVTLVQDEEKLIWPDSYSITADGYLYISCSQIDRMPWFNKGQDRTSYPYKIFRLKIR